MSETQSYKTVTFSPDQVDGILLALAARRVQLEKDVAAYEDAGWTESAERTQAQLDLARTLYEELRA